MADDKNAEGDSMFPNIGSRDDTVPSDTDEFLPGYSDRDAAVKGIAELSEKASKAEQELNALREREQTMMDMLDRLASMQPSVNGQPVANSQPKSLDFSSLPDPVEKPDDFKSALQAQIDDLVSDRVGRHSQSMTAAQQQQEKLNQLWNEFQESYDDLADFPDLVEASVREELSKAQARGLDAEQFMFRDKDRFMKRVAENTNRRIAQYKERFGGEKPDPDAGRTAGTSSGSSGFGSGKATGKGTDNPGSLIEDLKKAQRDSGFF